MAATLEACELGPKATISMTMMTLRPRGSADVNRLAINKREEVCGEERNGLADVFLALRAWW